MTYKFFKGASLTWREINIDWISIDESQLKAGTPMSAEGVVANDATAYGILMDDIDSYYNKKARVVTAGVCFLKRLQEHCGIALTAEARAALKNLREIEHDAALPNGGGFDGFVVVRLDSDDNLTCNMTRDEYNQHLKDFTISGGVLIHARHETEYDDGVYYECEQYFITSFAKDHMTLPDECAYSAIMFDSDDGTLIAELAGTGPM